MDHLIVDTFYGKVKGVKDKDIDNNEFYSFKGIPYAKPPINELRFQDPLLPEFWEGVRNAKQFGPNCCQFNAPMHTFLGSDDCLYLNIYSKKLDKTAKLPVLFWVHGGGFFFGSGDDDLYGPQYFLRKHVVLVTFNYRLGVLGFLNLEDKVAPGNQGFKDQVLALKWVKQNISNFGGDPDNVTIFGESAGGAAVHYLCLSPMAEGLFHKAIIHSGAATNPWASIKNPKVYAHRLASYLGFKKTDPQEIVEFLKTVNCIQLVKAQEKILTQEEKRKKLFCGFGPGNDIKSSNPFLPIPVEEAVKNGINVPLFIGSNNKEGIIMLNGLKDNVLNKLKDDFNSFLHPRIENILKRYNLTNQDIYDLYINKKKDSKCVKENYVDMITELHFVFGIYETIEIQTAKNISTPTYVYSFTYDKGFSFLKLITSTNMKGAAHFDELIYLFNMTIFNPNKLNKNFVKMLNSFFMSFLELNLWNPINLTSFLLKYRLAFKKFSKDTDDYKLMDQMTNLWINFAKNGVPSLNDNLNFKCQPVKQDNYQTIVFENDGLRIENSLHLDQYLQFKKLIK